MSEIVLKTNKTLLIKNAAVYTPAREDGILDFFQIRSKLKTRGVNVSGPVIMWDSASKKDDSLRIARKMILRCSEKPNGLDPGYEYIESLRFGPCMYSRIVCSADEIRHAFEKISVHAFENDIELENESFTVYVDEKGDQMTVDVFVPVK